MSLARCPKMRHQWCLVESNIRLQSGIPYSSWSYLLSFWIWEKCDFDIWIFFQQIESAWTPSAAEIKDFETILHLSSFTNQLEHLFFWLVQWFARIWPIARAIFKPFSKSKFEKFRGNFIMLFFSFFCGFGNSFIFTENFHHFLFEFVLFFNWPLCIKSKLYDIFTILSAIISTIVK